MIEIIPIINFFREPILNSANELKDEILQVLDDKLPRYLNSIAKKYGKINTFYHRKTRLAFYKVYFPITLRNTDQPKIELTTVQNLFSISNYCTLIGNAGSGKSMMFKHLFFNCLKENTGIPLVIELRNLNKYEGTLKDYIIGMLTDFELSKNEGILHRMLRSGSFVFLFDGYDEIYQDKLEQTTNDILHFIDQFSDNKFVISSRPEANIDLLPRFENFYLNGLKIDESLIFAQQQLEIRKGNITPDFKESVLDVITNNKEVKPYLKNPLLLSMFLLVFELNQEVPNKKSDFYDYVFTALSTEHNSLSKPGFVYPKKSNLSNSELRDVIDIFSFRTFFNGDFAFKKSEAKSQLKNISKREYNGLSFDADKVLDDFLLAIPVLIRDGLEIKFPHRSLQEFFAASFIKNLNTATKEKIYKETFEPLAQKGTDSFNNFWNLCSEIDNSAFTQFFIIPSIKNFLSLMRKENERDTIKTFMEKIDFTFTFKFNLKVYYQDGIPKYHYIDTLDCETIKIEWSQDFDFYKKLLSFLNIFKVYQITDLIEPRVIINNCDNYNLSKLNLPFINNAQKNDEESMDSAKYDYEDTDEAFARNLRLSIERQGKIEEFIYRDEDTISARFSINKLLSSINYFCDDSNISEEILECIRKAEDYLIIAKNNVQRNQNFNDDLIQDLLE